MQTVSANGQLFITSDDVFAAGPRRPGEGTEDEEQGIVNAEEMTSGCAYIVYLQRIWQLLHHACSFRCLAHGNMRGAF